jgi:hypothetical protein
MAVDLFSSPGSKSGEYKGVVGVEHPQHLYIRLSSGRGCVATIFLVIL